MEVQRIQITQEQVMPYIAGKKYPYTAAGKKKAAAAKKRMSKDKKKGKKA